MTDDFDPFDEMSAIESSSSQQNHDEGERNDLGNDYLNKPRLGLKLLADLVRANENPSAAEKQFLEIKKLIETDFLAILNKDTAPYSAKTWLEAQQALEALREVISFPEIENRHIVALGGQFSAGKSCFINSLLGDSLLPVDTNPTTAIPTYIYKSEYEKVSALNKYQHRTEIDFEALKAISHNFNCEDYQLTFSHILQLLTLETNRSRYQNITFLDTPGYSKSDKDKSVGDENIARTHLKRAQCLIWLVDIGNGTLTDGDIKFLKSLDFDQPILFIFNKADQKTASDIDKIVTMTKEQILADSGLNVHDVIAYSAIENKEYSPSGTVLTDYLAQIEKSPAGSFIPKRFEKALDDFCSFHQTAEEENRSNIRLFQNVMHEVTEVDPLLHIENRARKQIDHLQKYKAAVKKIQKTIKEDLSSLYKKLNIEILPYQEVHFKGQKMKKNQQGPQEFTFKASLDKFDKSLLDKLPNHNEIEVSIKTVSASGISLEITGETADIFIMKGPVKKALGDHKQLEKAKSAKLQYISNNSGNVTFVI